MAHLNNAALTVATCLPLCHNSIVGQNWPKNENTRGTSKIQRFYKKKYFILNILENLIGI